MSEKKKLTGWIFAIFFFFLIRLQLVVLASVKLTPVAMVSQLKAGNVTANSQITVLIILSVKHFSLFSSFFLRITD